MTLAPIVRTDSKEAGVEQNAVYEAEDGGVGADAEGEGQDGEEGEAGILTQHSRGVQRRSCQELFEPQAADPLVAVVTCCTSADQRFQISRRGRRLPRFFGGFAARRCGRSWPFADAIGFPARDPPVAGIFATMESLTIGLLIRKRRAMMGSTRVARRAGI